MTHVTMFALISMSPLVRPHDLYEMAKALEVNAAHCAEAWALPKPAIVVCYDPGSLPPGTCPILFIDDKTDPGVLAEHYWESRGMRPAGRVYVRNATGLNDGWGSICEGASHEVLEAMCDPECNQWMLLPREIAEDMYVAIEVSDPVQDTYPIEVGDTEWNVANFVLPSWFGLAVVGEDTRVDYAGTLDHPFDVGPEGYLITVTPDGADLQTGPHSETRPGFMHPLSRTARRIHKTELHPTFTKTEPAPPSEPESDGPPVSGDVDLPDVNPPAGLPPETPAPPPTVPDDELV